MTGGHGPGPHSSALELGVGFLRSRGAEAATPSDEAALGGTSFPGNSDRHELLFFTGWGSGASGPMPSVTIDDLRKPNAIRQTPQAQG